MGVKRAVDFVEYPYLVNLSNVDKFEDGDYRKVTGIFDVKFNPNNYFGCEIEEDLKSEVKMQLSITYDEAEDNFNYSGAYIYTERVYSLPMVTRKDWDFEREEIDLLISIIDNELEKQNEINVKQYLKGFVKVVFPEMDKAEKYRLMANLVERGIDASFEKDNFAIVKGADKEYLENFLSLYKQGDRNEKQRNQIIL